MMFLNTGEKPYACSVCPRAFNQRVVLREHIRSHHSGLDVARNTYHCTVCSEDLASSNDLIQHLIQHSDSNTAKQRQPIVSKMSTKNGFPTKIYCLLDGAAQVQAST